MRAVVFIAMLALGGCASGSDVVAPPTVAKLELPPSDKKEIYTKYTLSDLEKKAVQKGVVQQLKDPDSARFGDIAAVKSSAGTITVCGWVNAKNSYGGYTGDKPFLGAIIGSGAKLGFYVVGMGGTDTETKATIQVCQQNGVI